MHNARTAAPTYLVHHQLGAGGMGVVHLGTMVTQVGRRRVAIKSLKTGAAADRWSPDRLLEEARLVFQLTHANICQVIDLGSSVDGALFVVMEYVRGLDLRTLSSLLPCVEGWRGGIFVGIVLNAAGRIDRCHLHDPSWQNWPVLEYAVIGNIVPDFPLINKSFNLTYSGHDR